MWTNLAHVVSFFLCWFSTLPNYRSLMMTRQGTNPNVKDAWKVDRFALTNFDSSSGFCSHFVHLFIGFS